MKFIPALLLLIGAQPASAMNQKQCSDGDYSACKAIFDRYGSSSEKDGAEKLFSQVCSSQKLRVSCQILSTKPADTMKKTMELATPDSSQFVISGNTLDKIYVISAIK